MHQGARKSTIQRFLLALIGTDFTVGESHGSQITPSYIMKYHDMNRTIKISVHHSRAGSFGMVKCS
jgi:hypothetical protein